MINRVEKLDPNLNDKERYVVHLKALTPWMRNYIELNTNCCSKATSEFEKDLFKLMNNSVFGKNMENIRNRLDVRLVNKRKKVLKLAAKPNYRHPTIFVEYITAT